MILKQRHFQQKYANKNIVPCQTQYCIKISLACKFPKVSCERYQNRHTNKYQRPQKMENMDYSSTNNILTKIINLFYLMKVRQYELCPSTETLIFSKSITRHPRPTHWLPWITSTYSQNLASLNIGTGIFLPKKKPVLKTQTRDLTATV